MKWSSMINEKFKGAQIKKGTWSNSKIKKGWAHCTKIKIISTMMMLKIK